MTSLNVPKDIPISFYLLKQCKLWVWDFDDTLIDTETYLKKNMSPDTILKRCDAELDKEIPQWRYFRKLVEFLVTHGRYVGIASFGTYEIIQAYMKRIMGFNQQFFTKKNIIAPCMKARETYRFNIPPNKNEYIYTLMRIYRIQDFKSVVLFDDKPSNISDAIAIGIIGIQIATPYNGDNPNNSKMFFGPWIMENFDKQIKKTCGDEIYLNRTYTNMASKNNYIGFAYDNQHTDIYKDKTQKKLEKNEINYGTGIRAKNNYFQEPYDFSLDVDDTSIYKPVAFGSGIGERKVLTNPQFRWNGYKNSQKITPKWYNGNYVNIPNLVNTPGYWNENTELGGSTLTYWNEPQKILNNNNSDAMQNINPKFTNLDYTLDKLDTLQTNTSPGIIENFSNSNMIIENCGCKKFEWNWIVLLLVLLIIIMMVIIVKC